MKKPRVKDFDPNAVPELSSSMDDMPSIQKPTERVAKDTVVTTDARNLRKAQLQERLSYDGKEENRKIGNEDNRIIGKEENRKIGNEDTPLFDLSEEAYRKDSFFFTDDEFNAIVDLKIAIARKEGIKLTKTDLARIAFKMLIDNYRKEGEKSLITTSLQKRKPTK